ncbi:MAG: hypothetical protein GY944_17265 [bacterium]|nr:hypothetical protein [bacterium]MCP5042778.1 hypothetical protein [bacterium]
MPSSEDPVVAESAILGFCATLNAPVVNVDALDVGPGRAGILLSAGQYGGLNLWVRVSLISNGQGVTFKFQGDPGDFGDHRGALEAALSFAEGMGFLFEDDMLPQGGPSGRNRAHRIWTSLFEVPGPEQLPLEAIETGGEAPIHPDPAAAPGPECSEPLTRGPAAAMSPLLSKFRQIEPAPSQAGPDQTGPRPGAQELAQLELTSEELGNEHVDHAGFLARLLGSF